MRDWVIIGVGLGFLVVVGLLAHGCRGGAAREETVPLSEAEVAQLTAATVQAAEAARLGDTAALEAVMKTGLPDRELRALRAALGALKGQPALTVQAVQGIRPGYATVTLTGAGGTRVWRFDRVNDAWKLSGA